MTCSPNWNRRCSDGSGSSRSFDLDAATDVCTAGDVETWQVLDLLTLLVDKSLIAVDDSHDIVRYRLLETMRLYAHRRLAAAAEVADTGTRHRDHYLALAETAGPYLEDRRS